jgi:hydroxyethylthiazole kinase-like sugar kinase family protein
MNLSFILNRSNHLIQKVLITFGLILILASCVIILMGLLGVFSLDVFAIGLSSGIRILASVAITGCLVGAIGHWIKESL